MTKRLFLLCLLRLLLLLLLPLLLELLLCELEHVYRLRVGTEDEEAAVGAKTKAAHRSAPLHTASDDKKGEIFHKSRMRLY